jgi:hypothetical protein
MRGDLHDRIVARLVAERRLRRLTRAELVQRLGRPTSFVFRCEAGARYLDVAELMVIARARCRPVRAAAASRSGGLTGGHSARQAPHPLPRPHGALGYVPRPAAPMLGSTVGQPPP